MSSKCLPVIHDPSSSEPEDHDGLPRVAGSIPLGRRASIGALSDDVLLVVFGFYRVLASWHWHRLAHVCQRWRLIVFASPRSLNLRLYCTPRTLVKNTCCWPAFPIVIWCRRSRHGKHHGDEGCKHLSPEDEDNVVAALQYGHNRVRSIKLCLTNSLVENLSTQVKETFSELKDLVLQPIFGKHIVTSLSFRWGARLRILHLTDICVLSLPLLLSSSPNLVDFRLHISSITSRGLPLPGVLANALSGMTRLESLSLRSESFHHLRTHTGAPLPSGRRVILPALTRLQFRGYSQYLEGLVAEIDAPCLAKIEIASLSQIGQFINPIEAQRLHRLEFPSYLVLCLRSPGPQLNNQLSWMASVYLGVVTSPPLSGQDVVDGERWLRLLRQFRGAKRFYLAGELTIDIMYALQEGEFTTVLPALCKLEVEMEPEPLCAVLQAAVTSFATSRQLSGSPLEVEYRPLLA
ncbi:hypothetical protein EDB87DRAFT_1619275 [Lactarius vividus]|nr:hypothetical protein EDB87DRAFT_1619275 [Lactarius vividus]